MPTPAKLSSDLNVALGDVIIRLIISKTAKELIPVFWHILYYIKAH